jgi:hypothetical protein
MDIALIGNSVLRLAIQRNLVSFPSQIPGLTRRPGCDTQERIAQLYFARGWPVRNICDRYGLCKAVVQKVLTEWKIRAVAGGYIQDIQPEELDALAREQSTFDTTLPFSAGISPVEKMAGNGRITDSSARGDSQGPVIIPRAGDGASAPQGV